MLDQPHPIYSDWDASDDACARLWRSVILQAISDATGEGGVDEAERKAAWHFLTDQHSAWSVARTVACHNCGLDAARLRSRFLESEGRNVHGRAYRRKPAIKLAPELAPDAR
jgi:hypothetical protein